MNPSIPFFCTARFSLQQRPLTKSYIVLKEKHISLNTNSTVIRNIECDAGQDPRRHSRLK